MVCVKKKCVQKVATSLDKINYYNLFRFLYWDNMQQSQAQSDECKMQMAFRLAKGAVSFREPPGQTKVMQILQVETLNLQGAITHEVCCLAAQWKQTLAPSCSVCQDRKESPIQPVRHNFAKPHQQKKRCLETEPSLKYSVVFKLQDAIMTEYFWLFPLCLLVIFNESFISVETK